MRRGMVRRNQGRYKSFPVQTDDYFYQFVRYVERNVLPANLVERAEQWLWSSLCPRRRKSDGALLAAWPSPRPANWIDLVNEPQTKAELQALRHCVQRRTPFGDEDWVAATVGRLELEASLRPRGRPRKTTDGSYTRTQYPQLLQIWCLSPFLPPTYFGIDDDSNFVGRLPVAAPELICHEGRWYIAALNAELDGIRIARLNWVAGDRTEE